MSLPVFVQCLFSEGIAGSLQMVVCVGQARRLAASRKLSGFSNVAMGVAFSIVGGLFTGTVVAIVGFRRDVVGAGLSGS
jgi:hypothetical protein